MFLIKYNFLQHFHLSFDEFRLRILLIQQTHLAASVNQLVDILFSNCVIVNCTDGK